LNCYSNNLYTDDLMNDNFDLDNYYYCDNFYLYSLSNFIVGCFNYLWWV